MENISVVDMFFTSQAAVFVTSFCHIHLFNYMSLLTTASLYREDTLYRRLVCLHYA